MLSWWCPIIYIKNENDSGLYLIFVLNKLVTGDIHESTLGKAVTGSNNIIFFITLRVEVEYAISSIKMKWSAIRATNHAPIIF